MLIGSLFSLIVVGGNSSNIAVDGLQEERAGIGSMLKDRFDVRMDGEACARARIESEQGANLLLVAQWSYVEQDEVVTGGKR